MSAIPGHRTERSANDMLRQGWVRIGAVEISMAGLKLAQKITDTLLETVVICR
jgi:hypothetical protein